VFNAGTLTGTRGTAIEAFAATNTVSINQTAGVVNGAILLSTHDDMVNVSGGTINGDIRGQGNGTVDFNLPAGKTFTYAASSFGFLNVDRADINSGSVGC